MCDQYSRDHMKIAVAKILQTLGWHGINTTPLEVLTDILARYLSQLGKYTNEYANLFGQTQPNLDHLGLAFREMDVNLQEIEEYVTNVTFCPPPEPVPKYPIQKEHHLNFLKPGSKEVVTRPVHIHEHLPPMFPLLEGAANENDGTAANRPETEEGSTTEDGQVFKKPADVSPLEFKRPRPEEQGNLHGSRPTREISSVMMTTSGFLSPAREGKLPEARTPIQVVEPPPPPPPAPSAAEPLCLVKPPPRKVEKKKDKVHKELFKPTLHPDEKPKKANAKEPKVKHGKNMGVDGKAHPGPNRAHNAKVNKTLAAARLKTEKYNTTITLIPPVVRPEPQPAPSINLVGKLSAEPDKQKANILKKISNVKNEKNDMKVIKKSEESRSRGSSPDLVIDEPDDMLTKMNVPSDITIEPIIPTYTKSPEKMDTSYYFDDGSPPGTPSTPKTPELISHSPPVAKEKRKRKDSKRVRKVKVPKHQPAFDPEVIDVEMDRPKTPEALIMKQDMPRNMQPPMHHPSAIPFPFLASFGGPGLIPSPLNNPMFPFASMHFGKSPFGPQPPVHPNMGMGSMVPLPNFLQPPKTVVDEPSPPKPPRQVDFVDSTSHTAVTVPPVDDTPLFKPEKKTKEHKKDKKDKLKKKNKKDKVKNKAEKRKLKEEKKDKIKKEKKERKKDKEPKEEESPLPKLFLKIGSPSPRPDTPDTIKKLNIKPIVKKDEVGPSGEERKRETSPGLAKIAALVTGPPKPKTVVQPVASTSAAEDVAVKEDNLPPPVVPVRSGPGPGRPRIHPIKTKPLPAPSTSKPKKRRNAIKKDEAGNEVWICPGCAKQDDGSPMIGCDGCDAWYHWVCVGIQVPPDENENWYCRHCLLKKNEDLQSDKKKKRKKREKKEH